MLDATVAKPMFAKMVEQCPRMENVYAVVKDTGEVQVENVILAPSIAFMGMQILLVPLVVAMLVGKLIVTDFALSVIQTIVIQQVHHPKILLQLKILLVGAYAQRTSQVQNVTVALTLAMGTVL